MGQGNVRPTLYALMPQVPQVLQQLMRHADIQTTMRFYVDLKAQDLGQVIYAAASEKPAPSKSQQGRKSKPRHKPT